MFFLAGAIAGPVIGRWSDFIGRRAALLLVLASWAPEPSSASQRPRCLLVTGRFLQGVSSAVFALAYIVLSENLQAKAFGTSVGIIAAINGGIGGVDGYVGGLMAETLGFRSIFVVVLVLTAIAAACIVKSSPRVGPTASAAAWTGGAPDPCPCSWSSSPTSSPTARPPAGPRPPPWPCWRAPSLPSPPSG
jgi:MFS family permease